MMNLYYYESICRHVHVSAQDRVADRWIGEWKKRGGQVSNLMCTEPSFSPPGTRYFRRISGPEEYTEELDPASKSPVYIFHGDLSSLIRTCILMIVNF